jgi:uncharacterized protein (UPF0335 family)
MSRGVHLWPQPDGQPVSCRDKLEILAENYEELRHVMQDAFEDAVLMGVDEGAMRRIIADLVAGLKTPKR